MNFIKKLLPAMALILFAAMSVVCNAAPTAVETMDGEAVQGDFKLMSEQTAVFMGEGTNESPYLITDASEFSLLSGQINTGIGTEAHYALMCDIDLGGAVLVPIGTEEFPFKGTFNGNGYTIKNFTVSASEYCGVFGYTYNAVIRDFYLDNVSVSMTKPSSDVTKTYVGCAVAYGVSTRGSSLISGICVNDAELEVNGLAKYIYAGSVVGCLYSSSSGVMRIQNCYSRCNLSVVNTSGYSYGGGIAGRLSTDSGGNTKMMYCYNVGSISAKSFNSAHAGGLAGYVWSHGSSYAPDVDLSADTSLMSDSDIMISNCFAAANVYSESTSYYSRAGRVTAYINTYADCDKTTTLYTKDTTIVSDPKQETTIGSAASLANFKNSEYLAGTVGFDFEKVWETDSDGGYDFPVFKDAKRVFGVDTSLDLFEVTTDVTLASGNNLVNISKLSFVNGNTLYLDRGTYIIGDISGDCSISASPNANVIVLGDVKPSGYVELNIGEKKSSDNVRYAEVQGNQYVLREYNNKYGVITDKDMLIEIAEKGDVSSYYFVDAEELSFEKLDLDGFMNTSDDRDIRLVGSVGIRYRADFSKSAKLQKDKYEIVEYGFILALENQISEECQLNFEAPKYVSGVAYDKNGKDLIFDDSDDAFAIVTGVLFGIPEEHYKTFIAAKPYTKISVGENTFVVYGEQVSENLYSIAKPYENSTSLTDEQKAVVDSIIKAAETV